MTLAASGQYRSPVTWGILALLLFLRIPYTIAIIYLLPIENQSGGAVYEVGTYLLSAFLIWWERDRLADFHLDASALTLFILLRPIQTMTLNYWGVESPMTFPGIPSLIILGTSIVLLASLWKSGFKPQGIPHLARWALLGAAAGVMMSILVNYDSFQSTLTGKGMFSPAILTSASINLLYHLGFAPLNEEPLFRGFLWGMLRQAKWKERWILILQSAVFTSAHIYFASQYPLTFWVFIPLAAILFGLLTLRSRTITPAILAHGLINGSVYIVVAGMMRL